MRAGVSGFRHCKFEMVSWSSGLLEDLYHYIWLKSSGDSGFRGFLVPDTVVYKYQHPRYWVFTSGNRRIRKKGRDKLTAEQVEKEFLKRPSACGLVATYTYMVGDARVVEFLGPEELKEFLHTRKKAAVGILQKYVEPRGRQEAVLQVTWTPTVCTFEHRQNNKDLYDQRYDLYERAVTFESEEFHCSAVPVRTRTLKRWLASTTQALVSHVAAVTQGRVQINRLRLHFKQDCRDQIWLLRATILQCAISSDCAGEPRVPSTVNTRKISVNPQVPMNVQKTVLCRLCEQATEPDRMCNVSYKAIVRNEPGMPRLIQKLHSNLAPAQYEKFKANSFFLKKETLVCQDCFLALLGKKGSAPADPPFRGTQLLNPAALKARRVDTMLKKSVTSPANSLQCLTSRPVTAAGGEFAFHLPKPQTAQSELRLPLTRCIRAQAFWQSRSDRLKGRESR